MNRYRVVIRGSDGSITHFSKFEDEASAENYYSALEIPDSTKTLEAKRPDGSRYTLVRQETM